MKKALIAIVMVVLFSGGLFAAKKEVPVLTETQKYEQQLQALAQKRQGYLQAVQQIEIEMIKLQAIMEYIKEQETDEKESK